MAQRIDPLFGALIDDSDWFPSPAHVLRRAAILELMCDLKPGRVIDMGCGVGRWLADWARLGCSGIGVEPDDQSRRLAADCVAAFQAPFELVEAAPQPYHGAFDYLTAIEVLEHLEDPHEHLSEWTQQLRPGGRFLGSVPAFSRLWGPSDVWAGHVQRFEPEDFISLVERAGLTVETTRLYGYPLGNLTRILGNLSSSAKRCLRDANENVRDQATLASGRDRSIERRLRPVLTSWPMRTALRAGIAVQRRVPRRGIGVIVLARRPEIA